MRRWFSSPHLEAKSVDEGEEHVLADRVLCVGEIQILPVQLHGQKLRVKYFVQNLVDVLLLRLVGGLIDGIFEHHVNLFTSVV